MSDAMFRRMQQTRIHNLEQELKKYEWISVKDKLPPPDKEVLIWHKGIGRYRVDVARYREEHKNWQLPHWVSESVTHWMPLPQKPESE